MEEKMSIPLQIIISVLLLAGMAFCLGGSIGLIRFPDAYCRMHALGKPITLGVILCLIAAFLFFYAEDRTVCAYPIAAIIFILLTAPIATHMISKAAHRSGVPMWKGSVRDDLMDSEKEN
jgi:multicomponent Na+:H+ antiporter subunit G